MNDMVANWDRLLPLTFYYDHLYADDQKRITEQLNEFYFSSEPISEASRENLTNVRNLKDLQKRFIAKVFSCGATDISLEFLRTLNTESEITFEIRHTFIHFRTKALAATVKFWEAELKSFMERATLMSYSTSFLNTKQSPLCSAPCRQSRTKS